MAIKMIIFDKDGTLMDFDSYWVTVSRCVVTDILTELHAAPTLTEEMLRSIGVFDGVTAKNGILCYGTYQQISQALWETLQGASVACDLEWLEKRTAELYHRHSADGIIQPACANIKKVLGGLLGRGCTLALVTTDDPIMTRHCLEVMDIGPYFSAICTDDGIFPPKPDAACLDAIREQFVLDKDEIVMVGDTMTDVRFAKNGGVRCIAIDTEKPENSIFADKADAIVPDISAVEQVLDRWETV